MQKKYVIIVAGGTGSRMNSDLPKQFLLLLDKPILMHTLEQFAMSASNPEIIVVLHPEMVAYWTSLCLTHQFTVKHRIITGGQTRFQSVKNGLNEIFSTETERLEQVIIAIHDAARPIIEPTLIDHCFSEALDCGSTILAVSSTNSVRIGTTRTNFSKDREQVWIVQTPQTFNAAILKIAFQQEESTEFTDDASVVEKLGYPIHIIVGDHKNIKITFPDDIQIAQIYLRSLQIKQRPV